MSADENLAPDTQPAPQDEQNSDAATLPPPTPEDAALMPLPDRHGVAQTAADAGPALQTMEYRTPGDPSMAQQRPSAQWLLSTDPQSPEATQLLGRYFGLPASVVDRYKNECVQRYHEEQLANLTPEQIVARYLDGHLSEPRAPNPAYIMGGMVDRPAHNAVPATPTPPASATLKEAEFIAAHPGEAWRIGTASKYGSLYDISSNATRFATMGSAPGKENLQILNEGYKGMTGESNAFRHALWQAEITNRYGSEDAEQAGNSHEDDPLPNVMQRSFPIPDRKSDVPWQQADTVLDLLNNPIGRFIGGTSPDGAGMRNLAEKVLDYYHEHGLWDAVPEGDMLVVKKMKLPDEKYQQLKQALHRKDDNGEWVK